MEFSPTVSTVWVASLRPSGKTRMVNSTSARRRGVKSPFTMALARCHLPTGCVRLTWPSATVPMGSTSRSKANTDSSSFASTGAPRRLDTRFARYRRSGAPGGTLNETWGRASSAVAVWADADSEKREIPAAAVIPSPILMGPPVMAFIIAPATRRGACASSGWRNSGAQGIVWGGPSVLGAPAPWSWGPHWGRRPRRPSFRWREAGPGGPPYQFPYTLKGEPVLAIARILSSNSKPVERGLWLRTYHLYVSFNPTSNGVSFILRTRVTLPMFSVIGGKS